MKPVEFLQGKWLGHPLHPAIVHIPVGAWVMAAVLDVAAHSTTHETIPLLSLYCVAAGLGFALLAVPTGVAEWASIKKEKPAWKLGLYHMVLNLIAALLWAVNLGLRWQTLGTSEPITRPIWVTSVIAAALVLISGYLGTLMVFDHGTSVARQSKKKWREIARRGGARLPESS